MPVPQWVRRLRRTCLERVGLDRDVRGRYTGRMDRSVSRRTRPQALLAGSSLTASQSPAYQMQWTAGGSAIVQCGLLTFLFLLTPSVVMAQGQEGPGGCVTWEEFQARLEGGAVRRRNGPPPAHYTGIFIRFTGTVERDADRAVVRDFRWLRFFVGSILCGSPAATTGLREGDEILSVDGAPPHAPGVLIALQSPKHVDDTFRLEVTRERSILVFTVRSAPRPKSVGGAGG